MLKSLLEGPRGRALLAGLVSIAPVLVYQALYMNRFYPITEGWFSTYAWLIRDGAVPYRDFPLLLPPLYPVAIAAFQAVFGDGLLALHWMGLLLTGLLGMALFAVLRGLFAPWPAGAGAAIGLLLYQSGNAFIGYDFTQLVTFFMLAGTAGLLRWVHLAYAEPASLIPGPGRTHLLLSGASFGCALLTKHSNAAMVIAAIGIVMLVIVLRRFGTRGLPAIGWLAAGGLAPLALTALALLLAGAWPAFLQNVVVDAAGAKGGARAVLLHWLAGFFQWDSYRFHASRMLWHLAGWMAASALLFAASLGWRRWRGRAPRAWAPAAAAGLCVALLATAIAIVYLHGCNGCTKPGFLGTHLMNVTILWSVTFYLVGACIALALFLWRPGRTAACALLVLGLGVGLIFGNGTSGGLSEISAFLGVAVLCAAWLSAVRGSVLAALVPAGLVFFLAGYLAQHKFEKPYYWWSIETPDVRHAECARMEGVLHGLCVPPAKARRIQEVERLVLEHSAPTDRIYVFPHMPVFYLLTGRKPVAGAVVSWFDFMSDRQARALADELRAEPPAVLVFARLPDLVFDTHERLFRSGRLGQREIVQAVADLAADGSIREVGRVPDLDGLDIVVYARLRPPSGLASR